MAAPHAYDVELAAIKDAAAPSLSKLDVEDAVETTISVVSTQRGPNTRRIRREWYQFSTLCLCMWLGGWNDASLGPLLATIQEHYHINYTVVSTLFLFKCVGYIVGSFSNLWLTDRLGFGKSLVLGASLQAVAYAVQIPAPPFPVMMAMSWLTGLGMAIQHAQANSFIATGKEKETTHARMSMLHGFYGLGAVLSPFAATPFSRERHWSYINIISCGLSIAIALEMWHVFKGRRQHEVLRDNDALDQGSMATHSEEEPLEAGTGGKYRQVFRIRVVHYLAFVIVFYTGLEITIGGWIVTYLVDQRGGGASTGYVSSGFYGGLMVGRMILPPLSQKIGRRRVVFVYSAVAAAMDIVIWFVPSLIGDAVAASFMGMVLGPIYPLIMSGAGSGPWFPPHLVVGAIGWIAGFGQVGSATYPFIMGLLANKFGIRVLPPVALAMVAGIPALFLLALLDRQRPEQPLLSGVDSA
ncbi:MFS general substrate transporter [Auricularia subglabra TFB-10046 SS5]|uniref:MFS general substrate transporter n=1 Tax=Auricularia subglabra (strain TFB-10046 / SS5) TaxID=717982 RepID=J0WY31_AURST|nr:MFS general substrate transporter [Auricularia subglabra TFB-10046 SS5]